jgi:hypothetical protein
MSGFFKILVHGDSLPSGDEPLQAVQYRYWLQICSLPACINYVAVPFIAKEFPLLSRNGSEVESSTLGSKDSLTWLQN